MKFTKILLATLSLAFIQSCSNNDDEIIELNKGTLNASYVATRLRTTSI